MSSIHISAILAAALLLVLASRSPANAVTCEDVRNLTPAEQVYWSKRLNLTREQKDQIRRACNLHVRRATFRSAASQADR
jgi:hypothetical protein